MTLRREKKSTWPAMVLTLFYFSVFFVMPWFHFHPDAHEGHNGDVLHTHLHQERTASDHEHTDTDSSQDASPHLLLYMQAFECLNPRQASLLHNTDCSQQIAELHCSDFRQVAPAIFILPASFSHLKRTPFLFPARDKYVHTVTNLSPPIA